jgi:hypothetical protein
MDSLPPKRLAVLGRALLRSTYEPLTSCLLYNGSHSGNGRGGGYGRVSYLGLTVALHIFSYETTFSRRVRPGYYLDHLCENRNCWNPFHVEEVKQSVNEKRKRRRRKGPPRCEVHMEYGEGHLLAFRLYSHDMPGALILERA